MIRSIIMSIFLIGTLLYLGLVGTLFAFQRELLYHPPSDLPDSYIESELKSYEPVTIASGKLKLTSYFSRPKTSTEPIILVFHGNASHPAFIAPAFAQMQNQGYGIFLFEYRGYGGNPGEPTEKGLEEDATAALQDYLLKNFPDNPLIIYGQSLGSGVAVDVASRHPGKIDGLILEVPFASLVDVVSRKFPYIPLPHLLLHDPYRSDQKIDKVTAPKLFLLAGEDEVVGYETGQSLYNLATEPKKLVEYPNARHNTVTDYGSASATYDFIEQILDARKNSAP